MPSASRGPLAALLAPLAALLVALVGTTTLAEARHISKGISYGPLPCKGPCGIEQDDFMSEAAKPLWGSQGRGDLQVMRQLGADRVRLYGNNPQESHTGFLDEARSFGLGVVVGVSDYPFTQMAGNCMSTDFDCYSQLRASYLGNLKNGFLLKDGSYHPALREIIVINEPDLKLPGMNEPNKFAKGIISAVDGMLDAEKDARVMGHRINFTATFSFGVCSSCLRFNSKPSLGQMAQVEDAMLNPGKYGYTPKNDLSAFYHSRFHHSFNTANPARDIRPLFLDAYEQAFPTVPVVIQEYHAPGWNAEQDVRQILAISAASPLLAGVSFFEFQVRYDKGGLEMSFGMFGLGDYSFSDFAYPGGNFSAWCLVPRVEAGIPMHAAVAAAFGGPGIDETLLCMPDPSKVPLTEAGFAQVAGQGPTRIGVFVARVANHLGGTVLDSSGPMAVAGELVRSSATFGDVVASLASHPTWASWDAHAACVADRRASLSLVGPAIGAACGSMLNFNCADIPADCTDSVWDTADYVFGVYYREHNGPPLQGCNFDGAAALSTASRAETHDPRCLVRSDLPSPVDARPGSGTPTTWTTRGPPATEASSSTSAIFGVGSTTRPTTYLPLHTVGTTTAALAALACHFVEPPASGYFWDPSCKGGGLGCLADGLHEECRFCGSGPFVACPHPDGAPCSFPQPPATSYFWDPSCSSGGAGCLADGVHPECRFCGAPPFPPCLPAAAALVESRGVKLALPAAEMWQNGRSARDGHRRHRMVAARFEVLGE